MFRNLLSWLPWRRHTVSPGESIDAANEPLRLEAVQREASVEVDAVLHCTEAATIAISKDLERIVAEAQSFIVEIKTSLGALQNSGSGGSCVSATLTHQCTAVTGFLTELKLVALQQRQAAGQMLKTSRAVDEAARSVSQISIASRLLCMNTMIEAGRLGAAGEPMVVIADQMRSLSEQIDRSNKEIAASMGKLLPILQDIDDSSARIETRAGQVAGDFAVRARDVGVIADQLQTTATAALGGSDRKLEAILGCSHRAIESLQTQDIVSQRLKRVMRVLGAAGDPASGSGQAGITYLSETLSDVDARQLQAGEVQMF